MAVVFALIMFFPVYWMVNTAFKPPNEVLTFHPNLLPLHPTIDNFTSAINAPDFLIDLRNSVIITVVSVVLGLIVGFLGALALARFSFDGRRALILVLLGVQMVPVIAMIIPIYLQLQKWHQTNQLSGVILSYIVVLLPYTIWTLRGFIANVPRELDEAALVDGCTRWQTFTKIILPLTAARPGRRRDLRLHPVLERVLHHQYPEQLAGQAEPDGVAAVEPDRARHALGSADGRRDHLLDPGGDLLPDHPEERDDGPDRRRRQGLTAAPIADRRVDWSSAVSEVGGTMNGC